MYTRLHAAVAICAAAICTLALPTGALTGGAVPLDAHRSLGAPRTYRNLTVIPVYDSAAKATGRYTTLDEGLRAKVVTVQEDANGGTVNALYVTNRGAKPVYLMAGEVVLGGQQDRCLGQDTIVPPGAKRMPVTVFCVEHGRWTGRREFEETAKALATADIRGGAMDAAFGAGVYADATPGLANRSVAGGRALGLVAQRAAGMSRRVATAHTSVGEAQDRVWSAVARKNATFRAAPASGTYREVLQGTAPAAAAGVAPYERSLSPALGGARQGASIVGVVAAVNGRVVAADVFGDPTLFRKLWPKLLRSYAEQAAEAADGHARQAVSVAQAKAFLVSASDATSRELSRNSSATVTRLDSKSALTYRMAPVAGGALVHDAVLCK